MNRTLVLFLLLVGCAQPAPKKIDVAPVVPPPTGDHKSPAEIPVEDFFHNPALTGYSISPDGKTLALFKPFQNRMNIFVHPLQDPKDLKQLTFVTDRDISQMHWKGSNHLVFLKDLGGDENFHVSVVNVKTGAVKDLTPFKGVRARLVDDLDESSPTDILLEHNQRSREVFDLYRVNVETGASKLLIKNDYKIKDWLIDHKGNPRGGGATDGVDTVFYFEKQPGKPFEAILKTDFRNSFKPIDFTADNQHIFAITNLRGDLETLVEIDPKLPPNKFIVKTTYAHPKYDLSDAEYSNARNAIGRVVVVTSQRETYFLDPEDQKDWDVLKDRFPKEGLVVANSSLDDRLWVVKTLSDLTRGAYYVYDRTTKILTDLGNVSPWLQPELMSEMKTVHYKTRDGLTVEAYLTLPRGHGDKDLPVIIYPHGGPWARDEWGFNPEAQFLASRGYAVLRMNFRGSTGYGRRYWEASFKQWGKKMQDDITDGVHWLVEQGIANPKRVCIYGGSYGGYAALAGVTLTPDLYACAVDYVGISNLLTFLKTVPPYWKPFVDMFQTMVGDPEADKVLLTSVSPVMHLDKIRAPLFIAQGANDPRVNKSETDQMVEALHKRKVEVQYMVKKDEGHGFRNEENRFDFYRAMEKFLAKHLNGSKELR